ncbi:hypothetical protein B0O99DRAFT_717380 [Bisporella sp. PMI_857]|nr:hypothetical protein B0O99DRAFT_717380 [Bisporella sp. PMI_857]
MSLGGIIDTAAQHLEHRDADHPSAVLGPPGVVLQKNPLCCSVSSAIMGCGAAMSGFMDLPSSRQALCVCYTSSTWQPDAFDQAVKTCAEFASMAVPQVYEPLKKLEDFCANAGNLGVVTGDIYPAATIDLLGLGQSGVVSAEVSSSLFALTPEQSITATSPLSKTNTPSSMPSPSKTFDTLSSTVTSEDGSLTDLIISLPHVPVTNAPLTTANSLLNTIATANSLGVGASGRAVVSMGEIVFLGFLCAMVALFL